MSDNISTNTLFHFTSSIDNIVSILKNDFYSQYSIEDIHGTILNLDSAGSDYLISAVAMVCFCDIPLSQVKKHIKTYGHYAIGLSKKWAIKHKINPVLYAYKNSNFTNNLKAHLDKSVHDILSTVKDQSEGFSLANQKLEELDYALNYIKPYEGKLWKKGKWSKKIIRFYDEREWRYVPKVKHASRPAVMKNITNANKDLANQREAKLSFRPNDIKFIIVKKESEILEMIDQVISIKRDKFPYKEVQVLTTRIISMESISENF